MLKTLRFDPDFSLYCFGFCPGRRAHEAIRKAQQYIDEGYQRYLKVGITVNGVTIATEEGKPQCGALSPLLANIILDDLEHKSVFG